MSDPIKIPLTESQKNLLQSKELTTYLEPEMARTISTILSKGNKYYLYMDTTDLEDLIDTICSVANHEEYNLKLTKQLDLLATYLEKILEKNEQ